MNEPQKQADACTMIIFGATGDLTKRKLFPALYNLAKRNFLPDNFAIVGVGRQEMTSDDFRSKMNGDLHEFIGKDTDKNLLKWFDERTHYTGGDFAQKKTFSQLKKLLKDLDKQFDIPENYFFYLATPPSLFAPVTQAACDIDLCDETDGWRRFIYEKPFGHDLESAKSLNTDLLKIVKESQIYRIDHYLGKETVQNILSVSFRQFDFRADLESKFCRPHSDHGRRKARCRTARRLLRHGGRTARYDPESYFSARHFNRDGAAGFI